MTATEIQPLPTGTLVAGRYRVDRVVGIGGLGTVYRATDQNDGAGTVLALKELCDASPGARAQFVKEAQWLSELSHPNIPRVRDYFEWQDRAYMVMDFIEGENLEHIQQRLGGRPIPERQVLQWMLPICDALQHMHTRRPPILHRDVKPANIIISPLGEPHLVDLGIAKEHGPNARRTATFVRKAGTEGYAPPEQYASGGEAGPWSDVYALGAMLYDLLTGCVPPTALERVALGKPLACPREINPRISENVSQAVMRALALKPADRFPIVAEFAAALLEPIDDDIFGYVPSGKPGRISAADHPTPPLMPPPASQTLPDLLQQAPWVTSQPGATSRPGAISQPAADTLPAPAIRPVSTSASGSWSSSHRGASQLPTNAHKRRAVRSPAAVIDESTDRQSSRAWIAALLLVLVALAAAGVLVCIVVLPRFEPIDRTTPTATVNGYFSALSAHDGQRAWNYASASRNNAESLTTFLATLHDDDQRLGRVITWHVTTVDTNNAGQATVTVRLTRSSAPDTPLTYTMAMTQYDGTTWLIDNISTG